MEKQIHRQTGKKALAISATAMLAAAMLPQIAFVEQAYAAEQKTKPFYWNEGEAQPSIDPTIREDGKEWKLVSVSDVESNGKPTTESKPFDITKTFNGETRRTQEEARKDIPDYIDINEDGFSGKLKLKEPLYKTIPVHQNYEDYSPTKTIGSLNQNDIDSAFPPNVVRTINDKPVGYKRASWKVDQTNYDDKGKPKSYIVTATYTSTTQTTINYYAARGGVYKGTLYKTVGANSWKVIATYEAVEQEQQSNDNEEEKNEENKKVSYWINYYKEGTKEKIAKTKQVKGRSVDSEVTAEAVEVEGYKLVGSKTQKLILKKGVNEINFYYKVDDAANKNDNKNENENENSEGFVENINKGTYSSNEDLNEIEVIEEETDEPENTIPIVPIAIAGAVVVAGVIAGIVVLKRRKKNGEEVSDADAMVDSNGNVIATPVDELAGAGLTGAAAIAASNIVVPEPIIADIYADYEPQSQLIELIAREEEDELGNITVMYDQIPKADIEIVPSIDEEIPTILYLPATKDEEGNRIIPLIVPVDDAQYWIAIDEETVQRAPSKMVILTSADGYEIYRGSLVDENGDVTQQILLDGDLLIGALNDTLEEGEAVNISEEIDAYEVRSDEIFAERVEAAMERDKEILEAKAQIAAAEEAALAAELAAQFEGSEEDDVIADEIVDDDDAIVEDENMSDEYDIDDSEFIDEVIDGDFDIAEEIAEAEADSEEIFVDDDVVIEDDVDDEEIVDETDADENDEYVDEKQSIEDMLASLTDEDLATEFDDVDDFDDIDDEEIDAILEEDDDFDELDDDEELGDTDTSDDDFVDDELIDEEFADEELSEDISDDIDEDIVDDDDEEEDEEAVSDVEFEDMELDELQDEELTDEEVEETETAVEEIKDVLDENEELLDDFEDAEIEFDDVFVLDEEAELVEDIAEEDVSDIEESEQENEEEIVLEDVASEDVESEDIIDENDEYDPYSEIDDPDIDEGYPIVSYEETTDEIDEDEFEDVDIDFDDALAELDELVAEVENEEANIVGMEESDEEVSDEVVEIEEETTPEQEETDAEVIEDKDDSAASDDESDEDAEEIDLSDFDDAL